MRIQLSVLALAGLLGPAAAFVFVPTRAGVEAKWSVPLGMPTPLASDSLGNVYRVAPRQITALAERTGDVRWSLAAPAGRRFIALLDGGAMVVAVAASQDWVQSVQVLGLAAERADGDAPEVLWQREFSSVPPDGVYVRYDPATETTAARAAVLDGGRLHLLDAADGETVKTAGIGTAVGAPTWADGYAFIPTVAGNQAELVAVDLDDGKLDRLPARGMQQPAAAAWLQRAGALVLTGRNSLHVAKFVFVPQRTPEDGMVALPAPEAAYRLADADDGSLLVGDERTVAAYDPDSSRPRWIYLAPAGWTIADVPASAGDAVVLLERGAAGDRLTALALGATGEARTLWRQPVATVRLGGFHVPTGFDGAEAKPVVATLEADALVVRELASGAVLGRRALALAEQAPLWVEDSIFCLVQRGPEGRPAVLGFDLGLPEELNGTRGGWSWTVPTGERVSGLSWQAAGRLLTVETDQRLHVFE